MSKRNIFIDRSGVNIMFKPKAIYFEKEIENYELGKQLLEKYEDVPKVEIENHNNIEEMRKKQNKEFMDMKRNLIIGVRKTHKFVENHKTSDYLVPYTSLGCTAACMYCYLVCNYNNLQRDILHFQQNLIWLTIF